jgi:Glycosyl transferase family 11
MITIKLMGGLGNQMFQRAFGLALESRGYTVRYDPFALVEGTHREFSLGYFGDLPIGRAEGLSVTEVGAGFNPEYLNPPDTCTMIGYWQSEKYFLPIAHEVREAFRFRGPRPLLPDSIAIHVRRQDYVGLQHFHGMPEINYYREGVAHIHRRAGGLLKVLVLSDDRQWCRENFPSEYSVVEGANKYEDMKILAACGFAVIANSSFSWWGAWLGRQRIVVAPKQWFADASMDSKDIVPERWRTL